VVLEPKVFGLVAVKEEVAEAGGGISPGKLVFVCACAWECARGGILCGIAA